MMSIANEITIPTDALVLAGKVDVPDVDASKLIYSYTMNDGTTNQTAGSYAGGALRELGSNPDSGDFEIVDGVGGKTDKVMKITRNAESGNYFVRLTKYNGDIGSGNAVTFEAQFYIPVIENKAGMNFTVYTNAASDGAGTRMVIGFNKTGSWYAKATAPSGSVGEAWSRADGTSMAGKWHNLAITATKSTTDSSADGSFKAYLNGELVLTVTGLQINTIKADARLGSEHILAGGATGVIQYIDNFRAYDGEYIGQGCSIATEIRRLLNAKIAIKKAIESKGVTVGDGLIDTYADKIAEIGGIV